MRLHRLVVGLVGVTAAGLAFAPACGGGGGKSFPPGGDGSTGDVTASDGNGGGDVHVFSDGATCVNGAACGDGGVCAGGTCCAPTSACGGACCTPGQVCSFQACVTPGVVCVDSSDCAPGQYCEYSLGSPGDAGVAEAGSDAAGCVGGAALLTGRCLPAPPVCAADAGIPDAGALTCLEQCEYHPPTGTFAPTLAYAWGGQVVSPSPATS